VKPAIRAFDHRQFDLAGLLAAKGDRGISLCLPARDEAATIARIVESVVGHPLLDEVLVLDDHSVDDTATVAAGAGARVVDAARFHPSYGPGKGEAVWKAIRAARGDLLLFCDADLRDFSPHFVVGLAGPLLVDEDVQLVKAFYDRPGDGLPRGGGRVTELVARPLLHLLFPHLAGVVQPLAGEFAARRQLLESLPIVGGYGVDIGLLIDAAARTGPAGLAQVDLGVRTHRNRPLEQLSPMAAVVSMTALRRAGVDVTGRLVLERPDFAVAEVIYREMPPVSAVVER